MLVIAILICVALSAVNYFFGKSVIYPSVVFCSLWSFVLGLVWISGDFFYSVSTKTLAILVCGCAAFSLGAAIAPFGRHIKPAPEYDLRASNRSINWLLFVVIGGVPFVYRWIFSAASEIAAPNFFLQAYSAMTATLEEGDLPRIIASLIGLAPIVALLCIRERVGHGKRALLAFTVAVFILVMTGGRAGVVIMIFAIIAVEWLRTGRPSFKIIGSVCAVLLIAVTTLAIFVRKGDAREDVPLSENVTPVVQGLVLYMAGGIPAFSQVVESPDIIPHNWHIYSPVLRSLNQLGFHFERPPRVPFLTVGPHGLEQNIYTAYYAYMEFGWSGTMILLALVGFAATRVYLRGASGSRIATIVYGYLFAAMLLSPFSDYFFMTLNSSLRWVAFSWIVYSLPNRWREFQAFVSAQVQSFLAASGTNDAT